MFRAIRQLEHEESVLTENQENLGDFGGEIRLAFEYEQSGGSRKPLTGGSISGNVKTAQKTLELSEEIQLLNGFSGPQTVRLAQASITGAA